MVSGSLSSPSRGAFHLSLTVLVRYRSLEVFSLGEWSPQLPTRLHVSRGTQDTGPVEQSTSTGLSPPLVALSNAFEFIALLFCLSYNPNGYEYPLVWANPGSLATTTGISFDFFSSGY